MHDYRDMTQYSGSQCVICGCYSFTELTPLGVAKRYILNGEKFIDEPACDQTIKLVKKTGYWRASDGTRSIEAASPMVALEELLKPKLTSCRISFQGGQYVAISNCVHGKGTTAALALADLENQL